MLHMPPAMLMGGGEASYPAFVAHISTMASIYPWSVQAAPPGTWRTVAAPSALGMNGTPWNGVFPAEVGADYGAALPRIIQHGVPSEAVFNEQVANNRQVLFTVEHFGTGPFESLARNGYTSAYEPSGYAAARCTRILLWTGPDVGGAAIQLNPSIGAGPFPYTWI